MPVSCVQRSDRIQGKGSLCSASGSEFYVRPTGWPISERKLTRMSMGRTRTVRLIDDVPLCSRRHHVTDPMSVAGALVPGERSVESIESAWRRGKHAEDRVAHLWGQLAGRVILLLESVGDLLGGAGSGGRSVRGQESDQYSRIAFCEFTPVDAHHFDPTRVELCPIGGGTNRERAPFSSLAARAAAPGPGRGRPDNPRATVVCFRRAIGAPRPFRRGAAEG